MHFDGIDARAGASDHAQMRRACHQAGRDAGLAADDERVCSGNDAIELAGLPGDVDDFDLRSSREEIQATGRQPIGDHHSPSHANACPIRGSSSSSASTVWSPMCPMRIVESLSAP